MAIAAFLTALSVLAPVSACSGPTHAAFDVVAVHGPVGTSTDLTLAQISELAGRTGRVGRHRPLGFYIGTFGYTVRTDLGARAEVDCSESVHVTVTVMLVDRHIEIGKDLLADPCLLPVVRAHYQRHAASDDAILTEFATGLGAALQRIRLPPLTHDPALAAEDSGRVKKVASSIISLGLKSLDAARADARDGVDTAEETDRLKEEHCKHA